MSTIQNNGTLHLLELTNLCKHDRKLACVLSIVGKKKLIWVHPLQIDGPFDSLAATTRIL